MCVDTEKAFTRLPTRSPPSLDTPHLHVRVERACSRSPSHLVSSRSQARDLVDGAIAALPHVFGPVRELLTPSLHTHIPARLWTGARCARQMGEAMPPPLSLSSRSQVRELLLEQLGDEEASSEAEAATEPFQRLSLFSVDGTTGQMRQSMRTALGMLGGVVAELGGSASEAATLPAAAARQMLRGRLEDVRRRREELEEVLSHSQLEEVLSHSQLEEVLSHSQLEEGLSHSPLEEGIADEDWQKEAEAATVRQLRGSFDLPRSRVHQSQHGGGFVHPVEQTGGGGETRLSPLSPETRLSVRRPS